MKDVWLLVLWVTVVLEYTHKPIVLNCAIPRCGLISVDTHTTELVCLDWLLSIHTITQDMKNRNCFHNSFAGKEWSIHRTLKQMFQSGKIFWRIWSKCKHIIGICSNSALTMLGCYFGFWTFVKEKSPDVIGSFHLKSPKKRQF